MCGGGGIPIVSDLGDAAGDLVGGAVDIVNDVVVDPVVDTVGDIYMDVRDPLQAAAVVVGNYYFPGSSIITSKLVSDGAKEQLNTPEFRLANLGASAYGAYDGNFANYGFNSSAEAEAAYLDDVAAADAATQAAYEEAAAIAAAENAAAWDAAAIDIANSATPEFAASAASAGLGFKEALDYARAGLLINAVTGDPLGLSDVSGSGQNTFANSGFAQVPIPEEWKSPTYAASSAPIDLSTIFSNQNMLGGTQWENLPSQRNVSFNDIFAAGQQQTPMGTPVDINQIVSSILGQAATSQKPA